VFQLNAYPLLHRYSGGMPRLINILADNALVTGFARDARAISPAIVRLAARDLELQPLSRVGLWERYFGPHRRAENGARGALNGGPASVGKGRAT
jgi:general secretion pathway protein A